MWCPRKTSPRPWQCLETLAPRVARQPHDPATLAFAEADGVRPEQVHSRVVSRPGQADKGGKSEIVAESVPVQGRLLRPEAGLRRIPSDRRRSATRAYHQARVGRIRVSCSPPFLARPTQKGSSKPRSCRYCGYDHVVSPLASAKR